MDRFWRKAESHMDAIQLSAYRDRLIALRDDCRHELQERSRAIAEDTRSTEATSSIPTHPADRDSEGVDVEVALARSERSVYDEIEAALDRIEAGTFGICERCGREISPVRLDAVPYTSWCIDCATELEQ